MTETLPKTEIELTLKDLKGWSCENDRLVKTFRFGTFRDAIFFIGRLAFDAEELDHHPALHNIYDTVRVELTTHDAESRVTHRDIALARRIEGVAQSMGHRS